MSEDQQPIGVRQADPIGRIAKGPLPYQAGWLIPIAMLVNSLSPKVVSFRSDVGGAVVVVVLAAAVGLAHFFVVQIRNLLVQLVEAAEKSA